MTDLPCQRAYPFQPAALQVSVVLIVIVIMIVIVIVIVVDMAFQSRDLLRLEGRVR